MTRIGVATAAFSVGALAWAAAIPLAAFLIASPPDITTSRLVASAVYVAGAVVCHQKPERSFHLAGQPLPVCARCTGIYAGAALAVLGMAAFGTGARSASFRLDVQRARVTGLVAVLPTLMTLAWEWTTGTTPSNSVRAAAGLPIGAAIVWIVWWSARSQRQSR